MATENTKTIQLNKADFLTKVMDYENNPTEWVYLGDKPCIIDFYADWCGPCKFVAPILDDLAEEYADQVTIYKVDTEVERDLSAVFGIQSIPTIIFCPIDDGPHQFNGAMPKEGFIKVMNDLFFKEEEK